MNYPHGGASNIWRDDAGHNPAKPEIRDWGARVELSASGPWLESHAAISSEANLTYAAGLPGSVEAGDVVRSRGEGFEYAVALSNASDHDFTTAGGVKFYASVDQRGAMRAAQFGVVADGLQASASANRVALQAAINASYSRGSGEVILPKGVVFVDQTITLKRTTILRGGMFLTEPSSTLKLADSADCDLLRTEFAGASYAPTTDYVHGGGLSGLLLDGNKAGQTGANDSVTGELPVALNAKHFILSYLRNIRIADTVGHGIYWGPNSNTFPRPRVF